MALASCQPGRPVSIAAKRPPPTRAAMDMEGPAAERRTSSDRKPEMSRCATCCSTEFARARPSRLFTTTRCSMSKRATATWLVSDAVTRAFSSACSRRSPSGSPVRASKWSRPPRSCRSSSIDLRRRSTSVRMPSSSPVVSARRTRRSARTDPTCQSKGRCSRSVAPASSAALASRCPEQRARMGTRDQGA